MNAEAATAANESQIAYWNGAAGEDWVRMQEVMDAHMAPATDLLLEKAGPRPGEAVLDVGCGTGATLQRLAAAVGPSGRVLGVDISGPMLAAARGRLAGHSNAELLQADAQTHGLPRGFDLVLSRFGVMFFEDPIGAFANLARALRPGGRLAFVCWAALAENPWFALPLDAAARRLGPPEPLPPRAPGPLAFADPGYVREILAAAGFADIRVETESTIFRGFPTAAEEAGFACARGPAARLIEARRPDEATLAAIRAEIAERFARYERAGAVEVPVRLHYAGARTPAKARPDRRGTLS